LTAAGWQVRQLAVCNSSEDALDGWLRTLGPEAQMILQSRSLAVVADQQRQGRGQRGRVWQSPPGGLWLSAAMAWPAGAAEPGCGTAPLTLAAALGLALQLEALGLSPQIKWPNDLLLHGRKLAGLLARLRLAGGRVRWAQVGLGLNGTNPVPTGAIGLGECLPCERAEPAALLPLGLAGLDWARGHAHEPETVLTLANERLVRPPQGVLHAGQRWTVCGLGRQGSLLVRCGDQQLELQQLEPQPASSQEPLSPENPA
jgi:BirA family biotin operon repressor/biotin-[acetyl-CoA-carboxylase] ligase